MPPSWALLESSSSSPSTLVFVTVWLVGVQRQNHVGPDPTCRSEPLGWGGGLRAVRLLLPHCWGFSSTRRLSPQPPGSAPACCSSLALPLGQLRHWQASLCCKAPEAPLQLSPLSGNLFPPAHGDPPPSSVLAGNDTGDTGPERGCAGRPALFRRTTAIACGPRTRLL